MAALPVEQLTFLVSGSPPIHPLLHDQSEVSAVPEL